MICVADRLGRAGPGEALAGGVHGKPLEPLVLLAEYHGRFIRDEGDERDRHLDCLARVKEEAEYSQVEERVRLESRLLPQLAHRSLFWMFSSVNLPIDCFP